MKKLTALLLSLALVLGLAACGSTTPEVPKDDPQTPAEPPVQDPAASEEPQTGKTWWSITPPAATPGRWPGPSPRPELNRESKDPGKKFIAETKMGNGYLRVPLVTESLLQLSS
ncbi:MAG: hypothetical protein ACLVGA_14575 [Dysosmobacter sp.]